MGLRGAGQVPPLTANGELDRRALPVPEPHCTAASPDYVAPRRDIERTLCGIWRDLLHIDRVGAFTTTSSSWAVIRSWQLEWWRGCANRLSWRFTFDSCSNTRLLSASAPCSRISQRPRHVMHKPRVQPLTANKAICKLLSAQSRGISEEAAERLLSGGDSSGSAE